MWETVDVMVDDTPTSAQSMMSRSVDVSQPGPQVGKAPPIDTFTGQNPDVVWEDWLSTFELVANWNGWYEEEKLLQLARHKALQEWNLVRESSCLLATQEMQSHLDYGSTRFLIH